MPEKLHHPGKRIGMFSKKRNKIPRKKCVDSSHCEEDGNSKKEPKGKKRERYAKHRKTRGRMF